VITKSNWGGAQRYVYDLATSLDKELFDTEVIVGGNGLLAHKLEAAGIPVTSLHSMERDINLKKELLSAKELFMLFRKTRPDVVHLNSSKAGGLGAVAARLAGVKKIVFTAHAWAFNENRGLASKLLISFLHWVTVILSHQTIAVSESVKEQVIHMPFMKKKIEVVHLGIEPFECKGKEEARALLAKEGAPPGIWIGAISELHPIKGLLYALDAINLLKDTYPALQFYIIGEGEQRSLLEKQIIKRKLEGQVHLAGFIDDAKTYLKAFDIFVLPSLSEAFGYSLLEAGNAGIPIIASKVGGIPEVIDESGILVPSKSARAIADAIAKLIESSDERTALGRAMHQRANAIFTKEEMITKTSTHY
jgi:glycosyltransferase involved in cell wall biosynthesis